MVYTYNWALPRGPRYASAGSASKKRCREREGENKKMKTSRWMQLLRPVVVDPSDTRTTFSVFAWQEKTPSLPPFQSNSNKRQQTQKWGARRGAGREKERIILHLIRPGWKQIGFRNTPNCCVVFGRLRICKQLTIRCTHNYREALIGENVASLPTN